MPPGSEELPPASEFMLTASEIMGMKITARLVRIILQSNFLTRLNQVVFQGVAR